MIMKRKKGKGSFGQFTSLQMKIAQFISEKKIQWAKYFRMNRIKRCGRKNKFHFMITTDGLDACLLYDRTHSQKAAITDEKLRENINNCVIKNEIAIDPGLRTWIGGVRRKTDTRKEVSKKNSL